MIRFGTGGVDDAEDAEVIFHEYGHAIQDEQVPGFGSSPEAGAIGEGFGDYWAVTVSDVRRTTASTSACVADWDSVSYTSGPSALPAARRRQQAYPEDLIGEVHADGEIWSRALWDIRMRSADAGGHDHSRVAVRLPPDTTLPRRPPNGVHRPEARRLEAAKAVTAASRPRHPLGPPHRATGAVPPSPGCIRE